ncbi:phage virion morphogenesis protein [Agarivorans sp. B2Z047]|uniref:phage virion morphogenesis protein n=1 Tax=Agarivorans sp. B2Z047 TaxID=2652721 RepID=UPI00128E87D3|nr:phage virion morphogenesis protein [Agarivorans sp. B2Z047]MPW30463.1 phage virion morphogenesis protein [Agarivorans sp. B2Z047]UQN42316.1 phage virion morphogenesis protein [Agarivorans sp. B2Z047]
MSARADVDYGDLKELQARIEALATSENKQALMAQVGAIHESQVRRRIADEKAAPDGSAWEPWSEDYAKTRHGGQSLLRGEGDLLDSITHSSTTDSAAIGSPLSYAGVHQDGFSGAVKVAAHSRMMTQAFGKALKVPKRVNLGTHSRFMATPQREYLGLSQSNEQELLAVIGDFWRDRL